MNTFVEGTEVAAPAVEQEVKPKRVRKPKIESVVTGDGTAPEPKEPTYRDTNKFALTAKIHLISEKNPKRPGSAAEKDWEKYHEGMTVLEALQIGISRADILYNASHNFLSVEGYDAPAPRQRAKKVKEEGPADAPTVVPGDPAVAP